MSVANLFNLNLSDPTSVLEWSGNNQSHHINVQTAIFRKYNVNLPIYPIDPIPLSDFVTWLQNHQAMHSSINAILGTQSYDLTSIDPSKPQDVEIFAYEHAREHYNWSLILGVG